MNDAGHTDTSLDTRRTRLNLLRQAAKRVKSRHPKARTGGRGVAIAPQADMHIDPLVSANILEKGPAATPAPSPIETSLNNEPPHSWRAAGDQEVTVYCRPLNPMLLLIRTDAGTNGSVRMHPAMQSRFSIGKRLWVRPLPKAGMYELAGRYTQWGRRFE